MRREIGGSRSDRACSRPTGTTSRRDRHLRDPRTFWQNRCVAQHRGGVPQIDLFEMTDAQWDDGMALKPHGARRLTMLAWHALKGSQGSVVLISGSSSIRMHGSDRMNAGPATRS